MTELAGWGNYPRKNVTVVAAQSASKMPIVWSGSGKLIPRGLGRSYGDSALGDRVLSMTPLDCFLVFDREEGLLKCQAGVSLGEILEVVVPDGWFIAITPGTQNVTLGGAIAADVHGKNHHVEGAFSQSIESLEIALPNGEVVECSSRERSSLFEATCGGMGLTGIILAVTLRLKKIHSPYVVQKNIVAKNLVEILELFGEHSDATYSVAWIDCIAKGNSIGRSLLSLGEHSTEPAPLQEPPKKTKLSVPCFFPSLLLNRYSIGAFNRVYYAKGCRAEPTELVPYQKFFYPLDSIANWNRLYGRQGFIQYQFVLPDEAVTIGMTAILKRIADDGRGSFLAVLKKLGPENTNYLSFPLAGATLALDFKVDRTIFEFLDVLDRMVLSYGGRIYMAKDARMSQDVFRASYPRWEEFVSVREGLGALGVLESYQSKRLGI